MEKVGNYLTGCVEPLIPAGFPIVVEIIRVMYLLCSRVCLLMTTVLYTHNCRVIN
jgi:hypothetical protein